MRKFLSLLLTLAMVFSLVVTANAEGDVTATAPAASGEIVILHSNDVHGAIDGYAKMAALKDYFEAEGCYVLLFDAGDFIQGTTEVSASEGETAIELMNLAGYDLATLGNHEFDYGYENIKNLEKKANFPIVAANVLYNGKNAFGTHKVFTAPNGVKIGVFGLETPETATKANPAKIKGVSFVGGKEMYAIAQAEVDALKAEACDVIICVGHLGIDDESAAEGNRSIDLLNNVNGIDIFIDGHSHSDLETIKAATDGTCMVNGTVLTSTGTKFANYGIIDIFAGEGDTLNLFSMTVNDEAITTLGITPDAATAAKAKEISDKIAADFGAVFAKSEVKLNGDREPGNRTEETNLGDLITDAMLWYAKTNVEISVPEENVVALTNGGGIRAPIAIGDVTKKDINTVLPFGNTVALIYIKGENLLEALEASTYCTPVSIGGFPQVSGIEYTIDTTKEFDKGDTYPGSTYSKPNSIKRVTINSINGKAFDPEATYAVVSNEFTAAGGDTYYAFSAATVMDTGYAMDVAVMDYITQVLGGVIGSQYAEPQGRIHVLTQAEEWDGKVAIEGTDYNIWFTKYGNTYTNCKATNFFDVLGFNWGDLVTVKFLDQELVLPVVPTYSYVDSGTPAIIVEKDTEGKPTGYVSMAINMGNFGKTYGLVNIDKQEDGTYVVSAQEGVTFPVEVTYTMKEAGGYMAEYILHDLQRTNERSDYANLTDEQFANFRVVATTGMGKNVLYRSSSPVNPELGRNSYADAAAKAAGVKTFMNLADNAESMAAYEGFASTYYSKQNVIALNLGVDFTEAGFQSGLANGLRYFAAHEGPYLVHCTEGKDRAGYVTALLECLMGATADEVVEDYMVTYYNYYGVEKGTEKYTAIAESNIIKSLKNAFGVADLNKADLAAEAAKYMKKIGLSDAEIAALKANLAGKAEPTKPATPAEGTEYTVVAGDCLWNLAYKYYGSGAYFGVIAEANGIKDPALIYVGQKLIIPAL